MGDKRELRCFGQLIRMDRNRKPTQVKETRFKETQWRGSPRIKLEEQVWKIMRKKGKTFQEVTRLAKARKTFCSCNPTPERARRRRNNNNNNLCWYLARSNWWSELWSAPLQLLTAIILKAFLPSTNIWSFWLLVYWLEDCQLFLCIFLCGNYVFFIMSFY